VTSYPVPGREAMRYFFHTIENENRTQDKEGLVLAGDSAARKEADRFLADIAVNLLLKEGARKFTVEVTNENGAVVTVIWFARNERSDV
jgi:hypothetical protein